MQSFFARWLPIYSCQKGEEKRERAPIRYTLFFSILEYNNQTTMFRRSALTSFVSRRIPAATLLAAAPSLIGILASRASSSVLSSVSNPGTGDQLQQQQQQQQRFPVASHSRNLLEKQSSLSSSTRQHDQPLANGAVMSRIDMVSTLSQVRLLRSRWNLHEQERQRECERLQMAIAECKSGVGRRGNRSNLLGEQDDGGDDTGSASNSSSAALRNLERKLQRQIIASAQQRVVLKRVVRLLRHKKMKAALKNLTAASNSNHNSNKSDNGRSYNPSSISVVSNNIVSSDGKLFINFLSDVAFFSACLRKIQREVESLLLRKEQLQRQEEDDDESRDAQEKRRAERKVLVEFARVATIMPRTTKALISHCVNARAAEVVSSMATSTSASASASSHHHVLSCGDIVSLLFSGAKAQLFTRLSECIPVLQALLRKCEAETAMRNNSNNNSSDATSSSSSSLLLSPTTPTAAVHSPLSTVDTVRLSLWFTTVVVSIAQQQRQQHHRDTTLSKEEIVTLRQLCLLLFQMWVLHAPHFGGVGSREPWLLLSCVPELDSIAFLNSNNNNRGGAGDENLQQQQERRRCRKAAVKALLLEGLRGATAPASASNAHKFVQPWSNKNIVRGERIALLEQQLATNVEPRRLFALLALLAEKKTNDVVAAPSRGGNGSNDNSMRFAASAAMSTSVARAAIFGSLARALPKITIEQAGSLLMLVAGPSLDQVRSSAEAAAASNLVDAIMMRGLQYLDRHVVATSSASSSSFGRAAGRRHDRARMIMMPATERAHAALLAVRLCTALSHLSARHFLQSTKADADYSAGTGDGDVSLSGAAPTPRSRVFCETTSARRNSSIVGGNFKTGLPASLQKGSSKLVRVSKQEMVNLCLAALVTASSAADGVPASSTPSLLDHLNPQQKAALQRALLEMGELTPAREQLLAAATPSSFPSLSSPADIPIGRAIVSSSPPAVSSEFFEQLKQKVLRRSY